MRILIVEDDARAVTYLQKGLSEHGYVVESATEGTEGLYLAMSRPFDLILLDVMLPEQDGWSILAEMRRQGIDTPVVFLTARDSVPDRVKGLELGADDYLIKPFAFSELLARIRTILRRGPARQPECLTLADLEIDLLRHQARRNKQKIDLSPKEFNLLSLLARHTGEVLTRTQIAELVWDINFHSDSNVVDVAVGRLRRKIDDPFDHPLLHTVRRVGYILEDRRD